MRAALLALIAVLLFGGSGADAAPLVVLIAGAAFAATTAGIITSALVGLAVSVGLNYVATKLLAKKTQQPVQEAASSQSMQAGGTQLEVRAAADIPQSLIVGRAVTAGSLVHVAAYGERGDIDNSDLIEIIALADHPCTALHKVFIDGQEKTLDTLDGDRGYPVIGYAGALALRFFDGTQVAADAYAVAALSTATNQPWTSAFVGAGIAYVRTHSVYEREKVPGQMRWRFVVDGVKLYDPRKDSTVAGGSGAHRWGTAATYEWTQNVAVICYNILRGIYVNGEIFYGLEGTSASQLPVDVWFAAMNECDVAVALDAGGTEPQFTCGGEISIDTEPLAAIKELLKSCGGRLTENGGIYKLYVGAPGLPVLVFNDGNLLLNREDTFKPVLPLQSRVNYLTGSYTSPLDNWLPKVAPPRENTDWRDEDGRRLPADFSVPMVQSATQMQRLMLQLLQRARRERSHIIHLPPEAYIVEPGDTVQWSSTRNGYVDKLFEVEECGYAGTCNTTIAAVEIDPADHDWSTDDELAEVDGRIVTVLPAPKVIVGFDAEGFKYYGDIPTERPAIRLTWTPPTDGDVVKVRWQLRSEADHSNATSGDTDDVAAGQLVIVGGLQSLTTYEVRARFESFNGYAADWSLWIPVTTPETFFSSDEIIVSLGAFTQALRELVTQEFNRGTSEIERIERLIARRSAEQDAANLLDKFRARGNLSETRTVFGQQISDTVAEVEEVRATAVGIGEAFAAYSVTVNAKIGEPGSENGLIQASVTDARQALVDFEEGAFAQLNQTVGVNVWNPNGTGQLQASVTTQSVAIGTVQGKLAAAWSVTLNNQGWVTGIKLVNDGGFGAFVVSADTFLVAFPGVQNPTPVFQIAQVNGSARMAFRGDFYADGSVIARTIDVGAVTAIKIAARAVDTEKIAINGVDIINIIDGAASAIAAVTGANGNYNGGTTPVTVASLSIQTKSGRLSIDASVEITGSGVSSRNPYAFTLEIEVDGSVVRTGKLYSILEGNITDGGGLANANFTIKGIISEAIVVTGLSDAVHAVTVRLRNGNDINYIAPFLRAIENRR